MKPSAPSRCSPSWLLASPPNTARRTTTKSVLPPLKYSRPSPRRSTCRWPHEGGRHMSIAYGLDVLTIELLEAADRPRRVMAIAGQLAVLAHRLHQQEATAVPPHLRVTPRDLPPGVTRLCSRRPR